jgi:hypothetical protein
VLNTTSFSEERINTAHRAKLLYVYVRQSSPGQVRHHQESTQLGHVRQGGGNSGLAEVVRNYAARDGIGVESCGVMSPSISIIGVSNSAIASTCM